MKAQEYKKSLLYAGAGKTNAELRRIANKCVGLQASSAGINGVVYVTMREEVERCDPSRFLSAFGVATPPAELLRLRGKILFTIEGYDEDPAEIYEIEAVRKFYTKVHRKWPCWMFYADLNSGCLTAIACCIAPNIVSIKRRRCQKHAVHIPQAFRAAFFKRGLPAAALLHAKAGISRSQGVMMLKNVARYLAVFGEARG